MPNTNFPSIRRRTRASAGSETLPRPSNRPVPEFSIRHLPIESVRAAPRRLRKHNKAKIEALVASILHFGANAPIVVDEAGVIVDGHAVFDGGVKHSDRYGLKFIGTGRD